MNEGFVLTLIWIVLAFVAGYWYARVGLPHLITRGLRAFAVALPTAVSAIYVVLTFVAR